MLYGERNVMQLSRKIFVEHERDSKTSCPHQSTISFKLQMGHRHRLSRVFQRVFQRPTPRAGQVFKGALSLREGREGPGDEVGFHNDRVLV